MAPHAIIRENITVHFPSATITGDVLYSDENSDLVMVDDRCGSLVEISLNPRPYGLLPKPGHVFMKDESGSSESPGLTAALVEAGIVSVTDTHTIGPSRSTAYEARVLVQNTL
ncbi:hypothetical protein ANMWB30_09570 [Arthrobacter sp. MWB30]|nr:hypothetical protein ANMWB30_09570 [Arthrobacter sp. MWB30]